MMGNIVLINNEHTLPHPINIIGSHVLLIEDFGRINAFDWRFREMGTLRLN